MPRTIVKVFVRLIHLAAQIASTGLTRILGVLGAGPAGLTAAIALARAGHPVRVYDRAPDVGTRHEGDYEAMENWTTRENLSTEFAAWGIQTNFQCVPIHSLTCFGPGFAATAQIDDSQPLFHIVRRGTGENSLDHGLLTQAYEAGVQVEFGCSQRPEQVDIVASGFPRARAYVVGYTFKTGAQNACYMCLDTALTPTLYAYLILCEGQGTIGFGTSSPMLHLDQTLDRIVAGFRSRVRFEVGSPQRFAAAGAFGLPETAQRNGQLYVGEAAELQDPLFGFGLRMSMATGYLAARSILDKSDYDSLWQARLMPQLQAASVNRMLLKMMGNPGYRLVVPYLRLLKGEGRDLFHRFYHPMWYTRLLWPLARHALLAELDRQHARIRKTRSLRSSS